MNASLSKTTTNKWDDAEYTLLNPHEHASREGYAEGREAGLQSGFDEGNQIGIARGKEMGLELGFILGCCDAIEEHIQDDGLDRKTRAIHLIETIRKMINDFPDPDQLFDPEKSKDEIDVGAQMQDIKAKVSDWSMLLKPKLTLIISLSLSVQTVDSSFAASRFLVEKVTAEGQPSRYEVSRSSQVQ